MEPTVHSQKKHNFKVINQPAYRAAITAKLNLAAARLLAGREYTENNISDMYIEGRINSRPASLGTISKIITDGYWCVVNFVVVTFPLHETGTEYIHFLLCPEDDGTIVVATNSRAVINADSTFEDGDIGNFFD